jgi:predicted RNA-binding Zn ribbon-like protein
MSVSDSRWVWYGGRPSLDFANTRRDRQGAGFEYLVEPLDLGDWLRAAGMLTDGSAIDQALFSDAIALREAIDTGVRAAINGKAVPSSALRLLNRWLAQSPTEAPRLQTAAGVTVLAPTPAGARQALANLALDAARMLGSDERARLRICPGPGCGGRFFDDSGAGRRRWCSMAVCGNRHKAANHRHAKRP